MSSILARYLLETWDKTQRLTTLISWQLSRLSLLIDLISKTFSRVMKIPMGFMLSNCILEESHGSLLSMTKFLLFIKHWLKNSSFLLWITKILHGLPSLRKLGRRRKAVMRIPKVGTQLKLWTYLPEFQCLIIWRLIIQGRRQTYIQQFKGTSNQTTWWQQHPQLTAL